MRYRELVELGMREHAIRAAGRTAKLVRIEIDQAIAAESEHRSLDSEAKANDKGCSFRVPHCGRTHFFTAIIGIRLRSSGFDRANGALKMEEKIAEGFDVFVHDGEKAFGAVREVSAGKKELVVYVENAGDFTVPFGAVKAVHDEKVILDCGKLSLPLRKAIGHAHEGEDPRI
jgi:hypothetical protein